MLSHTVVSTATTTAATLLTICRRLGKGFSETSWLYSSVHGGFQPLTVWIFELRVLVRLVVPVNDNNGPDGAVMRGVVLVLEKKGSERQEY